MARRGSPSSMNRVLFIALAIVFAMVGLTVVLSVAESTIPDASTAYYDLANSYNATVVGTSANSIATDSTEWLGYLWVVLPFAMAAALIIKAFKVG